MAYSQFVGYGYTSCLTCHYNAAGNGPLNDYGRMLAATEIAGRALGPSSDEKLAAQSGFFGTAKLPVWWRPSIGYRGLYMNSSIWKTPIYKFIHMQADFTNAIRFDEDEKLISVVNFGYAPTPQGVSKTDAEANRNWISREHYLRWTTSESMQLYFGFMDKAYGIRVPDHEAYSRRYTYNGQNDQVHGMMLNYNKLPVEFTLHAFGGNLLQSADTRQSGGSMILEFETSEKTRIGLTGQYLKNNYIDQVSTALMTRLGIGHGSAILMESGFIKFKPKTMEVMTGFYGFIQSFMRLSRGFHFLTTAEYYTSDVVKEKTRNMRWGPGIQYFPFQRFELRLEVWNQRSIDPEQVKTDDWSALSQVHLWF